MVIRSVPMCKNVFGSMHITGPRQPNQHERCILHMNERCILHMNQDERCILHMNTLLCASWCPRPSSVVSTYIKRYDICSRSVGEFGPPKEEGGVQHFSSSSKIYCFSHAALSLFASHDKLAPIHVAK